MSNVNSQTPPAKSRVLVVGTNARTLHLKAGRTHPIGNFLNEIMVPTLALVDAGHEVVIATPDGDKPWIDPGSRMAIYFDDEAAFQTADTALETDPRLQDVRTIREVIDADLDAFDGVFVPGGYGPVMDLMVDADLGEVLRHANQMAKPTAFLCHGPIALISALPRADAFREAMVGGKHDDAAAAADGWVYAGYRMTMFSDSEEHVAEQRWLGGEVQFLGGEALAVAGGRYEANDEDFQSRVVIDRELITGQNPQSDHDMAKAFIAALDSRKAG